jgi:chemotaxis protein MotB
MAEIMSPRSSHDTHDESYFASFTDLLVGIIFIFIILLMIFANNYQEATESVTKTSRALEEARNKALQDEINRLRSETSNKELNEARDREVAQIKAFAEAKSLEAQQAAAEAKDLAERIKALEEAKSVQSTILLQDAKPAMVATSNDDAMIKQLRSTQRNLFNDSLGKVLNKIQETLRMEGHAVTVDPNRGVLLIPEDSIFDQSHGAVSDKGKQSVYVLSNALGKYLPCISPTKNPARLSACAELNFSPNDGLDAVFIDDYPNITGSKEDRLVLAVQRTVAIFNELKADDPYLYKELKNTSGVPILNIKVSQERRKAWNRDQNNPAIKGYVVFRFSMRPPNQKDLINLKNSGQ